MMTEFAEDYPEHEKLSKHLEKAEVLNEFFCWMVSEGFYIGSFYAREGGCHIEPSDLIAKYVGVDEKKLKEEKKQILRKFQMLHRCKRKGPTL